MVALNGEILTVPCQLLRPEDPLLLPVHELSLFTGTKAASSIRNKKTLSTLLSMITLK
jgi:hypothetical protein